VVVTIAAADSDLVRAARGLPVRRTPVWFMRQAGRSLPEYRALRAGTAMLEACQDPDLVTEITLQPVRRHGVDAAILFSDIVLPLVVAGVDIDIVPGVGPVVASPVRSVADVDALPELDVEQLAFLQTAVRRLVAELGSTPAPPPSSYSTRGPACSRPPTTPRGCCRTRGRCSTGSVPATCPASTSASPPVSCSR
jgi:uroporphyrinogen-III decarboxylase